MMAHISIATAAVGLAVAMSGATAASAEPMIRASLVDGHVYVSPLTNPSGGELTWLEPGGHFTLLGRGLAAGDPTVTLRHPAVVESHTSTSILHRWQVDRKRVHFLTYSSSQVSSVHSYERYKAIQSCPLEFVKKLTAPVATTLKDDALLQEMKRTSTWEDRGPLLEGNRGFGRGPTNWTSEHFGFDFLPAADGRYEWYVSEHDVKQSRLTRWDSTPPAKKGEKTKWDEVSVLPGVFGNFYATAAGAERNLVTERGPIYAAPRGAKAGTPFKEIWKGPVVEVLIHDADNAKWYGFTKDQYFEVADPIKPKPHTLVIRRDQSVNEPNTTRSWGTDEALDRAVIPTVTDSLC